ncbi:DUF4402 domain-containing protein [Christiangramia salexigens]|uniref:DUF4402 domain-containing protein n=1 Tax=Christiangramia salexigens TaxID=1913577 RepID=A0A1L3J5F1_9FLAO|nr:DUF4402 domain-containing protein [Christiangramia salexigens]APG60332.1 hypothetical protein LPB144_07885 [Christiangramia salexigens]
MKNLTFFATIFVMSVTSLSYGQVDQETATATAEAVVVKPIAISVSGTLNFGEIIGTASGGTVTVSPAAARSGSAGLINSGQPGTVSVPTFTVTGEASHTFTIDHPASFDVTETVGGSATMSVGSFQNSLGSNTGTLDGSGTETFELGGTITVGANQTVGTYENTTDMTVTVYYN